MGYPLTFALRYLASKKRGSISAGTAFAILGVALGVAALATIMSVTGGFHQQFRSKVLGVNAHVLVLKYSTNFREYRGVMDKVAAVPGVIGVAPFSINPMMLTHGGATATGVLVKGVDPRLSLGVAAPQGDEWGGRFSGLEPVLDLPQYVIDGSLEGLRRPGAMPAASKLGPLDDPLDRPPGLEPSAELPGTFPGSAPTLPPPDIDTPSRPPPPSSATATASASAALPATSAARRASGTPDRLRPEPARSAQPPAPRLAPPEPATSVRPPEPGLEPDGPGGEALDAGLPAGPVEPDGGYRSVLPDEDDLPDDVDPDPCDDPQAVRSMPGMVVGVSLVKTLDLHIGDCLTVTSPTIGFSFSQGEIRPPVAKRFRVIAVFEAGFDQYDSKLVYTDLYEAQDFYDHGDTVTGVEMKVADIDRAGEISRAVAALLTSGIYHTMDWEELNHGLFTALTIQQWGMSAVLALIIVVAAFTVVATLIMVVLDKRREISVMKAMGATDSAILRIFLYQGGIIGVVGTGLGLLLGLGVCKGLLAYGFPLDPKVYFISQLPVLVRWQEFAVTGLIAIGICLVATILPSLYASSLRPADGFRHG